MNWNGLDDTLECLVSIQNYCKSDDFLVVLVDNNSSESIEPLFNSKWDIPLVVIKNSENKGFAEGNNVGIEAILKYNVDYILLLNNDTLLLDDLLAKMTNIMFKYPNVGIAGAVNYYYSDPGKIWQAGAKVSLQTGKIKLMDINPDLEIMDMDYVPGSSLMFRSSVEAKIGALDANFFAYSEELDFCLRAKKEKFDVVCIPAAKILHKVGKSSPKPAKEYLRLRNKFYLFKRHSKPANFLFISLKETFKAFIKAGIQLFKKGSIIYYSAIYYAIRDYNRKNFEKGEFERFL
ncbi:glycosyltransferase family 2 protein [Mucilaginibacter sp. BJC16-A38]|uniref:glycosyltransferase family 2 protein n=1 Tax=Mucilaginibacter phenanthrenivorans TaxID=1234842 RepID=UPI0021574BC6|nr:glycosyltransferase family 2 protein [Mucilaginibacter phenanthrenivorans]MCR8559724.1 glycosyltransferase family 2 protein [Mucilaginibacter phenanthrenivorans]